MGRNKREYIGSDNTPCSPCLRGFLNNNLNHGDTENTESVE